MDRKTLTTQEWESSLINEITSLKEAYSTGLSFLYKIKNEMNPTEEQLKSMDTLLITLKVKIERLESELILHRILKGED